MLREKVSRIRRTGRNAGRMVGGVLVIALTLAGCQSQQQTSGGGPPMPPSPGGMPSPPGAPGSPGSPGVPMPPSAPGMPGVPGIPAPPAPPGSPGSDSGDVGEATDVFEDARQRREQGAESGDTEAGADGESETGGDQETAESGTGSGQEGDGEPAGGSTASTGTGSGAGGEDAAKDGAFEKALEDFDGAILEERGVIIARANETAGANPTEAPPEKAGRGRGEGSGSGNGAIPDAKGLPLPDIASPPPPPPRQETAKSDMPADIPDARDDDVVARQLREAAMRETDPELRAKLWEEYRRYKGST